MSLMSLVVFPATPMVAGPNGPTRRVWAIAETWYNWEMLKYHQNAIDLLPVPPSVSDANASIIGGRERLLGMRFSKSVAEWYALDGSVDLLRKYSNCDHPVPIDELGAPIENWYGNGRRDFVEERLLWFMTENQGVCNWAIDLQGGDDPAVLVEVDSPTHDDWKVLASSFSEFIYCQIWDHPQDAATCGSQEEALSKTDLQLLQERFVTGPTTACWPGNRNLRFGSPDGRVLIWDSVDHGADWWLFAVNAEAMARLIESVWDLGKLSETLYFTDHRSEAALKRVRDAV